MMRKNCAIIENIKEVKYMDQEKIGCEKNIT